MSKVKKPDNKKTEKGAGKMKNCPLIKKPFEECYCMNMSSMKIYDAIYYCGNNYKLCPIYKEKAAIPKKTYRKSICKSKR
ncbi:MAG: hypothetical protein OEV42_04015 [Deltaproteobacteria bacterium]|nr:hypothetical protein [Deltaproteobacteria bacterium]